MDACKRKEFNSITHHKYAYTKVIYKYIHPKQLNYWITKTWLFVYTSINSFSGLAGSLGWDTGHKDLNGLASALVSLREEPFWFNKV